MNKHMKNLVKNANNNKNNHVHNNDFAYLGSSKP